MPISKSTTLSKLNLLNIRNQWSMAIVKELSKRRGSSAALKPLYRDTKKRMRESSNTVARKCFQHSLNQLIQWDLIFEVEKDIGSRIYLQRLVWELDDEIVKSIESATKKCVIGRRQSIKWKTVLKEVRAILLHHQISLPRKTTSIFVHYFLIKKHRWKMNSENILTPSNTVTKKPIVSTEHQQDLFS